MKSFWDRVEKGDGCWLWTGSPDGHGYGKLWVGKRPTRTLVAAHRYAWVMANGAIPGNLFVLHKCDVPLCVRHDHLFLGTAADNTADMLAKGRDRHGVTQGVDHPGAKLTEESVRTMRAQYAAGGVTQKQLARTYGVAKSAVGRILLHQTWRHVL